MTKVKKEEDIHKRRILKNPNELIHDLKEELPKIFEAFYKAANLYHDEVALTPPSARCRGHEATILNSKMIQCISEVFIDYCKFIKYKRFMLRINGYAFLFKKLDRNGMPMNTPTANLDLFNNQQQGRLFDKGDDGSDPVLYFGYQMNRFGEIVSPQIVYIDENKFQWRIIEDDIQIENQKPSPLMNPGTVERKNAKLRTGTKKTSKVE